MFAMYAVFAAFFAGLLFVLVRGAIESLRPQKLMDQDCRACGKRTLYVTRYGAWKGPTGEGRFTEAQCRTCGTEFHNYKGTWERQ